jgi:WD40 repeat protein
MDGRVRIFDALKKTTAIRVFEGHDKRVFNVAYNFQIPTMLASGSDDYTVRVWDMKEG